MFLEGTAVSILCAAAIMRLAHLEDAGVPSFCSGVRCPSPGVAVRWDMPGHFDCSLHLMWSTFRSGRAEL